MFCVHLGVTIANAKKYTWFPFPHSDSNVDASVWECDAVGNITIANSYLSLDLFLQYFFSSILVGHMCIVCSLGLEFLFCWIFTVTTHENCMAGFGIRTGGSVFTLLHSCVALDKWLNVPKPQFPHVKVEWIMSDLLMLELFWGSSEIMFIWKFTH